jgi:nitroreductase
MDTPHYFFSRATVRNFSDKSVSENTIKALLEAAIHAPNTGNMQLYSAIITTDAETLAALAPCHFNQPASKAPALVTFCADFNRFNHWCKLNGATPGYDNMQSLTWGIIDASILAQQFVTVAEMAGLATCYLGTTTYNAPKIAEILDLPSRVIPVATIALGYAESMPEATERLPLEAVVHSCKYHDYSDEDIARLYHEKENLAANRKFVEDNAMPSLAHVFTDVRYRKQDNEYFSKVFMEFISNQGFEMP